MENTSEKVPERTSILGLNVDRFNAVVLYSQNGTQMISRRENDLINAKTISLNRMEIMEPATKPFRMCLGFGLYTVYTTCMYIYVHWYVVSSQQSPFDKSQDVISFAFVHFSFDIHVRSINIFTNNSNFFLFLRCSFFHCFSSLFLILSQNSKYQYVRNGVIVSYDCWFIWVWSELNLVHGIFHSRWIYFS